MDFVGSSGKCILFSFASYNTSQISIACTFTMMAHLETSTTCCTEKVALAKHGFVEAQVHAIRELDVNVCEVGCLP